MKVLFLGHAGFVISGNKNIVIDPFLKDNPRAVHQTTEISADYILITHGHNDHLGDALAIAEKSAAKIVAINEIARYAESKGLKAHGLNIGGKHDFGYFQVKLTPALHSSSLPTTPPTYLGLATGFLLTIEGKTIYHSGDTALFSDMALIAKKPIDLAMLPIGDNYTMGPTDALAAIKLLQPKLVIPIHYNTWPIIVQDENKFKAEVEQQTATKVIILHPGEEFIL